MTRPAAGVRRYFRNPRVESGRVGSGGVGNDAGRIESRDGSSYGSGRVGSGQKVFNYHASGRVAPTRSDPREVI